MSPENYIFGYGSLINAESRTRTGHSGEATPVTVTGIQRVWNLVAPQYGLAAVGAVFKPNAKCNGVIVEVEESELPKFDAREEGYNRIRLDNSGITPTSEGIVWTYVADAPGRPSEECPIVQSYIDVIITACMEYGDDFVKEFIQTTYGWDSPWLDDRLNPRYPRPLAKTLSTKIDNYLKLLIPQEFSQRKY